MPAGTDTFPQLLQDSGYRTAFIGKWHMGGSSDAPRDGFDRWVSFPAKGLTPRVTSGSTSMASGYHAANT